MSERRADAVARLADAAAAAGTKDLDRAAAAGGVSEIAIERMSISEISDLAEALLARGRRLHRKAAAWLSYLEFHLTRGAVRACLPVTFPSVAAFITHRALAGRGVVRDARTRVAG